MSLSPLQVSVVSATVECYLAVSAEVNRNSDPEVWLAMFNLELNETFGGALHNPEVRDYIVEALETLDQLEVERQLGLI